MEDYSESSSVRMEREMMQQSYSSQQHEASNLIQEDHSSGTMEDSSNNSLAAFDSEIRRMTRDADKILNDIRQETNDSHRQPSVNVIPEDDDDNDDDTVADDASLKGELERLDLVSMEIRKSLETTKQVAPSPWKFPPPNSAKPNQQLERTVTLANVVIWGLVLYVMVHASYRLVDSDGYLRLLL